MDVIIFPLIKLVHMLANILVLLIVVRALISWVNPDPYNTIVQFLYKTTEPILMPIRRLLPAMPVDISPIIAFVLIQIVEGLLVKLLVMPLGY